VPVRDYAYNENRYRMLAQSHPERAEQLLDAAQEAVVDRWRKYQHMASMEVDPGADTASVEEA
jgi:pyruvate-ferredoxin/flavodoxin oxidoreductase